MKNSEVLKDKYIPLLLGCIGVVLCAIWVLANSPITTWQEAAHGGIYRDCAGHPGGRIKHLRAIRSSSRVIKTSRGAAWLLLLCSTSSQEER